MLKRRPNDTNKPAPTITREKFVNGRTQTSSMSSHQHPNAFNIPPALTTSHSEKAFFPFSLASASMSKQRPLAWWVVTVVGASLTLLAVLVPGAMASGSTTVPILNPILNLNLNPSPSPVFGTTVGSTNKSVNPISAGRISTGIATSSNNTDFNFTLAFLTSVTNKGEGKFVGGAFFLALDHLNNITEDRLKGTGASARFGYVYKDTKNEDTTAVRAMVDIKCDENVNVTAFIGPDNFCSTPAVVATSFHVPFLSYDCTDIHNLRSTMGDYLMVNMQPSTAYAAKSIVSIMMRFRWTSFWLVTGQGESNEWADIGQYLKVLTSKHGIAMNDVTRIAQNDQSHTFHTRNQPYEKVVSDSSHLTRVYVFLGDHGALVDFLRVLNRKDITSKGQHVVISVLSSLSTEQNVFLRLDELQGVSMTETHLDAFRNVILLKHQKPEVSVGDTFEQQVYEKNYQHPINLLRIPDWWGTDFDLENPHRLRQESFYLYDAVMRYGHAVFDSIAKGQDPYNGSAIIEYIRNATFRSIQGFDVFVNADGESEGRFVALSLAHNGEGGTPSPELNIVGTFEVNDNIPTYRDTNYSITWVSGHAPVSNPECGFDGSKCGGGDESKWKLVAIGIGLAIIVVFSLVATFMGIRYWLIVRRMRRQQALAASDSFLELQSQDREGLLVC